MAGSWIASCGSVGVLCGWYSSTRVQLYGGKREESFMCGWRGSGLSIFSVGNVCASFFLSKNRRPSLLLQAETMLCMCKTGVYQLQKAVYTIKLVKRDVVATTST